jgi:hypothetical protein
VSAFTKEEEEMASTKATRTATTTRKMKAPAKTRTKKARVVRGKVPKDKVDQMIACITGVLATHEPGDRRLGKPKIVHIVNVPSGTGGSAKDELSITVTWVG